MKLGYVGIGLMGKPMVLRLLAAGHEVTVWNRSPGKLAAVVEKGAKAAGSPAAVAKEFGVQMPMVRAATELYHLLRAQGKGGKDPAVLMDLFSGRP